MSTQEVDVAQLLRRLNDRLERLEQKVDALTAVTIPIATLGQRLPQVAEATATMAQLAWDASVEAGVDPILLIEQTTPQLPKIIPIVARAVSVETITVLDRLSRRTEDLALLLDMLDGVDQRLAVEGMERRVLMERLVDVVIRLAKVAQTPELTALVQAQPFEQIALDLAHKASIALVEARREPVAAVGLFGVLRALGEPEIQKATAFGLQFARRFGRLLK